MYGSFHRGLLGREICILLIDKMSRKTFIQTLKTRSEVAIATLELIKTKLSRTQATLIYLRSNGAKDYKTKLLHDFLCQQGISHEATERHCRQSNGYPEKLNVNMMDKVAASLSMHT